MRQTMTTYYDICGILRLGLNDGGLGGQLKELLDPFRVREVGDDFIELNLCRRANRIPKLSGGQASGIYKGIPWRVVFERDDDGRVRRIFFRAHFFVNFLVLRIVLIPCVKNALVQKGGFSVPGSVFRRRGTTFLLFGQPGSGKTLLTLKALERGASLVADNELLISEQGIIQGLFNEIELRYQTVHKTQFWCQLRANQRMKLVLFHLISLLSSRRISFNISLPPAELSINTENHSLDRNLIVVHLTDQARASRLTADEMMDAIIAYEKWYQSVFGAIFFADLEGEVRDLRSNMEPFFSGRTMWRLPASCAIDDVFALSPEMHT